MTENILLNWAVMAVSLFNTVLLLWLGLTVLLNSDQHDWGIWLASGGLLMGAAFFISHTAIIGVGLHRLSWVSTLFWWVVGVVPAVCLPFAWYVVMLWYSGFWVDKQSTLYRRQRVWFSAIIVLLVAGLLSIALTTFLVVVPVTRFVQLRQFVRWSIAGIPLLAVGYSIYLVLCIGLSLDALRRPGPSRRIMGSLARVRARPWLAAASVALFVAGLFVTGIMLRLVLDGRQRPFTEIYFESITTFAGLDLLVSAIITLSILALGQAVVSYEVFTGKSLPRRGLLRHWRRAVLLAAGYGWIVGATIAVQIRPVYTVVLGTVLMTLFLALISWRSYAERDRYIDHLRPFIASERLYDRLLNQADPTAVDVVPAFQALCADLLNARIAYLVALGPLAPLAGPPLAFPARKSFKLPSLADIASRTPSPQTFMVSLDPERYLGAVWGIPLWSERGLIGAFLLGEKSDHTLYTQEEIEIARISAERLIDTRASAEMSRRLMSLQRQRLAQSQVIDQQTRRVLHDDILPTLQTAMIALAGESGADNGRIGESMALLTEAHRQISDLLHDMPTTSVPEVTRLGLVPALRQVSTGELDGAFDTVKWNLDDTAVEACQRMPALTAEVTFYAAREVMRNAARYGRGRGLARPFTLSINIALNEGLVIRIMDNGIGLEGSAGANRGTGQGLALHSTMMAVVGGSLAVDSLPGAYTEVTLTIPWELQPD